MDSVPSPTPDRLCDVSISLDRHGSLEFQVTLKQMKEMRERFTVSKSVFGKSSQEDRDFPPKSGGP